jgi:hypothetical protein
MGEVIQFIPKSERERVRLIREARAIYDSIFPPSEPVIGPEQGVASNAAGATKAYRRDGALLP